MALRTPGGQELYGAGWCRPDRKPARGPVGYPGSIPGSSTRREWGVRYGQHMLGAGSSHAEDHAHTWSSGVTASRPVFTRETAGSNPVSTTSVTMERERGNLSENHRSPRELRVCQ